MRALLHSFLRALNLVDDLRNDIRFALRSLRKQTLVSVTVVVTLGFGLGLNTGVFTLINAALFRAYVDKDPSTFFHVIALYSDRFVEGGIGLADYKALLAGNRSVRDLAPWDDVWTTFGTHAPTTFRVAFVSCNFFSVYGLERPESGRFFLPSECSVTGSGPVAIISDELWRSDFEADPKIEGRIIQVGSTALTIVGVTPPRFSGRIKQINLWIPYTMVNEFESAPYFTVDGRLRPGYSRANVHMELNVLAQRQDRLYPLLPFVSAPSTRCLLPGRVSRSNTYLLDGLARPPTVGPFAIWSRNGCVPGVISVCFAESMPMERGDSWDIRVAGQPAGTGGVVATNSVSTNFFETLGIPILQGRAFEERDSSENHAESVAIVSENFAREFWPGEEPVGKVIEAPERLRVIGVSRNSRSARYGEQDGPQIFRLQKPNERSGSLLVRFQGNYPEVARVIAEVLHNSGGVEAGELLTLKAMMDRYVSSFWAIAEMVLFLGIAAVALAVIGIYGVAAFAASRRTKEFGIRMALGAMRVQIIHLVVRSGAKQICSGLLLGICFTLGASHGLAKLMKNAPYVLDTHDPLAYLSVCLLLILSATAAMLIPALRATATDPVHALREE